MEYMLLLYGDEAQAASMPIADKAPIFKEFAAVTRDLQQKGQLKHTDPLEPTRAATTVRMRQGELLVTDGPFAETKEQLGGYYLIDAKNLDEAIAIAARIPTTRYGSVEIRPIMRLGGGGTTHA